ncbi:MAG: thermonuclease family protein [Nitrospinota bacterium]
MQREHPIREVEPAGGEPIAEPTGGGLPLPSPAGAVAAGVLFALLVSGCAFAPASRPPSAPPPQEKRAQAPKDGQAQPPLFRRDGRPNDSARRGKKQKPYWIRVIRVIDGATFSLENLQVVRLLGVMPPRPSTGKTYIEFFKRVTTPAVRKIVEGKRVRLMRDKVIEDREGRTLVYLFLEQKTLLNATLIQKGYARVSREVPFKLQDEFSLWEQEAQDIGLGVWARIGNEG